MRTITGSGFADDDGAVSAEVDQALSAYRRGGSHAAVLAVLQRTRLLVPVVAMLGEAENDERGLTREKSSDMATVLMRGRDGRMALLAFTGSEPMRRWDARARPVPVSVPDAARAARHDGAEALLVDVAGPVMFVVEGEALTALAEGFTLAEMAGRHAWVRPSE